MTKRVSLVCLQGLQGNIDTSNKKPQRAVFASFLEIKYSLEDIECKRPGWNELHCWYKFVCFFLSSHELLAFLCSTWEVWCGEKANLKRSYAKISRCQLPEKWNIHDHLVEVSCSRKCNIYDHLAKVTCSRRALTWSASTLFLSLLA